MSRAWVAVDDNPVSRAVSHSDAGFIRGFLNGRFDVDVELSSVEKWICRAHKDRIGSTGWSAGTWAMWFKSRIAEENHFGTALSVPRDVRLCCELHCFFLFLEENELHMQRLTKKEPGEPNNTARSKISKTTLTEIHPIDTVAQRVVPEPHQ